MLVEFCKRRDMYIPNTWFCQDKHRRYTWKQLGDTGRYKIDYVLAKCTFWNSISNAKTYPGADINSDHSPVVVTLRIRLKKVYRAKARVHWNLDKLKDDMAAINYHSSMSLALDKVGEHGTS